MERARTPQRPGAQAGLKVLVLILGMQGVVFGAWAFFWPQHFFDTIVLFDPYNLHLIHDAGAFLLGLGASLLAALWWSDGLLVALAGGTVGAVFHEWSHIIDADLGGRRSDPWALGVLALLFAVALVWRLRTRGRS